jgi:hypothetical protein
MQNRQKAKPAVLVVLGPLVATVTSRLLVADASSSDSPLLCLAFLAIFLFFSLIPLTEHLPPSFLFAYSFLSRFLPVIYIFLFSTSHVHWAFSWGTKVCIYWGLEGRKTCGKEEGLITVFFNIYIVSFSFPLCSMSQECMSLAFTVDSVHFRKDIVLFLSVNILFPRLLYRRIRSFHVSHLRNSMCYDYRGMSNRSSKVRRCVDATFAGTVSRQLGRARLGV